MNGERSAIRHAREVDDRLHVLGDILDLRVKSATNRRAIVAAITQLLPSLREHAAHLDDSNDCAGPLPPHIAVEVDLFTA